MAAVRLIVSERFAYREALPAGEETGDPVVLVHGFPESSRMWVRLMEALSGAGRRCLAPDLYCLGDDPSPGPATYERQVERFGAWVEELGLGRVALVVHDWGSFAGLTWAARHRDRVSALVISNTGFFSDGRWHGMAKALRSEQGEELIAALDRDGFAALLRSSGKFSDEDVDAYWAPFESGRGRAATLEFYRSMDFAKLAPHEAALAEIAAPTLLLWGAEDQFAPLSGARRFEREIPGAELMAIEGAGHFVFDQEPEATTGAVLRFLT